MHHRIITALSLIIALSNLCNGHEREPLSTHSQPRYWVHFTDRGAWESLSPEEILAAAIADGLTETSLARRRIEGLTSDSLATLADLPPDSSYLAVIRDTGVRIRRISRWFNRISVEASEDQLPKIESLPFVESVIPVAQGRLASFSYEEVGRWDGYPPPGPGADLPGMYGPSYNQALQVNAVEAHRQGYRGRGVLMVLLDSGFELSHEAFRQIDLLAAYDFIDDDDNPGMEETDPSGQSAHGTGCLSTIAGYSPGNLIGIAHEATFILAKTEDTSCEIVREEDDFLAALEWAERLGARTLSASLSYKDWYDLRDYDGEKPLTSLGINRAFHLGMICTTSMGNEGPEPMTLGAPAESFENLGSGAVDSTGEIARFSSRGPSADGRIKPDLCTMGVRTAAVSPFTEHRYSRWNGTSLSAPVLGGVMTLVRGAHPEWSAKKTREVLKMTASRADRPDNTYGWGIPDVMAAIRYPEIRFTFVDAENKVVDGVSVQLFGEHGELLTAQSERGVVSFPNLEDGLWTYQIIVPDGWKMNPISSNGKILCPTGKSMRITLEKEEFNR